MKKKCKILTEFKTNLPLHNCTGIKLFFPRKEIGQQLVKSNITICDLDQGVIEFELSDFEIDCLKEGDAQTFAGKVYFADECHDVVFAKAMSIGLNENQKKVWK